MKIALVGSAPSSVNLAPYGDESWQIWACSPGTYPILPRSEKFFELHRWEPGVIGKAATQKPWFSPEYCMWLARHPCVVMTETTPDIPGSVRMPREKLIEKYGSYFFTSSLAWMFAMAIDAIQDSKEEGPHSIGMWGVDMAASEEYGYQRAGCQFFIQIAHQLGIEVVVPPESDLMLPAPLYGVVEHSHMHVKLLMRKHELEARLNNARAQMSNAEREVHFLTGAISDLEYHMNTWIQEGQVFGADFRTLFEGK